MTAASEPPWTSSELVGSTEPRLWTPPRRELTPATSYGFDVIDFADRVLERPLDPWQQWLVVHAGELLPDGRPRFRIVLVLVARQNGKTETLVVLSLFWLFVELRALVLGTSTNLDYARESWEKAIDLAQSTEILAEDIPKGGIRRTNGEQMLRTAQRCRYKIAASNRKGGRSLTIHRLIMDELREHHDWSAWQAAVPAMNAVPDAQAWAITNQGDEKAVVLESLRGAALKHLEHGQGDDRLGMFEWSAPEGANPLDPASLVAANPNLGYRIDVDSLLGDARRAVEAGGDELAGFKTEVLCMRVPMLDPAVDPDRWGDCLDPGDMSDLRSRIALCLDVALDGRHASLVAAAVLANGRVRVEVVAAWSGEDCTRQLRHDLPEYVRLVRPQKIGWFPQGPAAAVDADLADRKQAGWPPAGVKIEAIRQEVAAVCMGFAEQVESREIAHSDDPMLNAHVIGTEKSYRGDAWVFTRKGAGHCDGTYAAAGAVHLARKLPPTVGKPRLIRSRNTSGEKR